MGSRFTKLSVGAFAIELAAASAQSKSIAALDDIRDTASHASVADSSSALIQSLREDTSADYAIVNLGDGQEWLTSRLYLATSIVPRMRGISVLIFNGKNLTFLGLADVHQLRWQLATRYPWLEVGLLQAYNTVFGSENPTTLNRNL